MFNIGQILLDKNTSNPVFYLGPGKEGYMILTDDMNPVECKTALDRKEKIKLAIREARVLYRYGIIQ